MPAAADLTARGTVPRARLWAPCVAKMGVCWWATPRYLKSCGGRSGACPEAGGDHHQGGGFKAAGLRHALGRQCVWGSGGGDTQLELFLGPPMRPHTQSKTFSPSCPLSLASGSAGRAFGTAIGASCESVGQPSAPPIVTPSPAVPKDTASRTDAAVSGGESGC